MCEKLVDGYHNLNYGQKERGEVRLLSTLSAFPLSCFIDAGANSGDWTSAVKQCFPPQPSILLRFTRKPSQASLNPRRG
jgi:hypothetical protein